MTTSGHEYDLVVVGAGPGGYVGAIRAAQLGLRTAIVERDRVGGVCLNVGCIPSKSLIHQAGRFGAIAALERMGLRVDRSEFDYGRVLAESRHTAEALHDGVLHLLKKNGVELVRGTAQLTEPHEVSIDGKTTLSASHVLLATGSRPLELPQFPFEQSRILSSTDALMLEELPPRVAIVGSGYIGIEFAHIWNSFGVSVHVVELLDRVLPAEDSETADVIRQAFERRGICFSTGTTADASTERGDALVLTLSGKDGATTELEVDLALVAVGRRANTDGLGLDTVGIAIDARGFVSVQDYYETDVPSVCAVGDLIGPPQLAHAASREAEIAVAHMAGQPTEARLDPDQVPCAVYCEPQLARFGYTEDRAQAEGVAYRKSVFPFRGVGKAVAGQCTEGFVKVLTAPETDEILGAHVVGSEATELIHELLLAKTAELLPEDIGHMIHAHPTLSEALREAMEAVSGRAIHI